MGELFKSLDESSKGPIRRQWKGFTKDDVNLLARWSRTPPTEPLRVCRRPVGLSYAAMGMSSSLA